MKAAPSLKQIARSPHFWVNLAILVFLTLLHYVEQIGIGGVTSPSLHFGLTRHSVDRVLFLVPIIYSCHALGFGAGLAVGFISLVIMLPRAIFLSPVPSDALLEVLGVMLVGVLASQWLRVRGRERDQYQRALDQLQSTHEQLQSYVRIARSEQKRLASLNALSAVLTRSFQLQETLKRAVDLVMDMLELEVMLVFSLQEDNQELVLLAHKGVSEEFAAEVGKVKVGDGFYGRVAQTAEPIAVEDGATEDVNPAVKQMKIRAQLIVPLAVGERVVGVLSAGNRRPREFGEVEVDLLSAVGGQIGIAIENARLYERERLATQRALASERSQREIFENANDAIWMHDLRGDIIAANKAMARLSGYDVEDLLRMNVKALLSKESLDLAGSIRHKLFEGEVVEQPYEQRLVRRDGTDAILQLTTNLIAEDGKPKGFQHIARDVTSERRMQDNLRFYLGQIVKAQEDERKRIARELHDDTAQVLYAVSRQLDNFLRQNEGLPHSVVGFLLRLQLQVNQGVDSMRRFTQDLRPPMIDELGLLPTLRWLAGETEKQYQIKVELAVLGTERRLSPDAELLMFRIVQEALRNAGRHAQASSTRVTIEFGEGRAGISVVDDGKGFKVPDQVSDLAHSGKLGLVGIQERVRLLGGHFSLQSQVGKGTAIEVLVPL
ncbi:MAG: PAS domain S-box protein [Pseudomonadota bacterium]